MPDRRGLKAAPATKTGSPMTVVPTATSVPTNRGSPSPAPRTTRKPRPGCTGCSGRPASVCLGMSGLRGLHQERSAWSYPGDQSTTMRRWAGIGPGWRLEKLDRRTGAGCPWSNCCSPSSRTTWNPSDSCWRGMDNVKAEWTMFATALNLQALWRVWRTGTAFRWNPIRVSTNLSDSLLA